MNFLSLFSLAVQIVLTFTVVSVFYFLQDQPASLVFSRWGGDYSSSVHREYSAAMSSVVNLHLDQVEYNADRIARLFPKCKPKKNANTITCSYDSGPTSQTTTVDINRNPVAVSKREDDRLQLMDNVNAASQERHSTDTWVQFRILYLPTQKRLERGWWKITWQLWKNGIISCLFWLATICGTHKKGPLCWSEPKNHMNQSPSSKISRDMSIWSWSDLQIFQNLKPVFLKTHFFELWTSNRSRANSNLNSRLHFWLHVI